MAKLIAVGELMVDLMPTPDGLHRPEPGGAVANVAACVARLGGAVLLVSRLSTDAYGDVLRAALDTLGIDASGCKRCDAPTGRAVVSHDARGERSFVFERTGCADTQLAPEDMGPHWFEAGDIVHFGSLGMAASPTREAHWRAVELAQQAGCSISFDVNLRPSLWPSEDAMVEAVRALLPYADYVKVGEEERWVLGDTRVPSLVVTRGGGAASWIDADGEVTVPAAPVPVVDTTGAGDAFWGAILAQLLRGEHDKAAMLALAHRVAGIVCGRYGGMMAMPAAAELD